MVDLGSRGGRGHRQGRRGGRLLGGRSTPPRACAGAGRRSRIWRPRQAACGGRRGYPVRGGGQALPRTPPCTAPCSTCWWCRSAGARAWTPNSWSAPSAWNPGCRAAPLHDTADLYRGLWSRYTDDLDVARTALHRCIARARDVGEDWALSTFLSYLAAAEELAGNYAAATAAAAGGRSGCHLARLAAAPGVSRTALRTADRGRATWTRRSAWPMSAFVTAKAPRRSRDSSGPWCGAGSAPGAATPRPRSAILSGPRRGRTRTTGPTRGCGTGWIPCSLRHTSSRAAAGRGPDRGLAAGDRPAP